MSCPLTQRQRIQAWVKSLRSGKYKQAKLELEADDSYCCLGVACLVAKSLDPKLNIETVEDDGRLYGETLEDQPDVMSFFGFSDNGQGKIHISEELSHNLLTELNDDTDIGFEGIANVIEEEMNFGKNSLLFVGLE